MKKMYKAIALALCAVLLVAGSVFGTLAYLKSQTETLTNTFTAGKVEITLHEFEIDNTTGKKTAVKVTKTGLEGIKLIPGRVIEKNPVITVKGGSEACYLFVEVVDGMTDIATINWVAGEWTKIDNTNVYYYKAAVPATAADVEVPVFPSIKCVETVEKYESVGTIKITAYAVQAEGFDNAAAAWSNTFGKPNNNG